MEFLFLEGVGGKESVQLATGSFPWLASRMLPWLIALAD